MILSDKIKIEKKGLRNSTIKYYSDLGYYFIEDYIFVNVSDIHKNSQVEILVECYYCNVHKFVKYSVYNSNISNGGKYSCSRICGRKKAVSTNLERWGVDNPSKSDVIKDKVKITNLERFGVDSYSKTDEYKDRVKNTSEEKWGVSNVSKSDLVRKKVIETNLNRYGVVNTFMVDDIKDKIRDKNITKWGVDNYTKTQEYKEKVRKTSLEKWGVENYTQTDEYKEKVKNTSLEKWGVEHYTQTNEYKERTKKYNLEKWGVEWTLQNKSIRELGKITNNNKWGNEYITKSELYRKYNFDIANNSNYIEYISDGNSLFICDQGLDHNFYINSSNYYSRYKNGYPLCTICFPISKYVSFLENELLDYIKSIYDGEIIQSYRDKIEIDIYLPNIKIGFEFNGLYWHSDEFVGKYYHRDKSLYFNEKGIRIIHVWEDDWKFNKDIIKSQISNTLHKSKNRIFARKCEIREVSITECKYFLNENHIQGYVNSNVMIGLYHGGHLVSLMTFDCFEGRRKMEYGGWNLSRFCNKIDTNVVGGASKLLRYFINIKNPTRIISYADCSWSDGGLYRVLGFDLLSVSNPDYKYLYDGVRRHKSNFSKSKLKYECTENEYSKENKIKRIWDCGKMKFSMMVNLR